MGRSYQFDTNEALDKAMNLFWIQGFEKTSVQQLCNKMGIEKGSMYHTFGDKHTLFLSALARYQSLYNPDLGSQMKDTPSLYNLIENIFSSVIDETNSSQGCLVVNTMVEMSVHDDHIRGLVTENMESIKAFFFRAIQMGQETGEFSLAIDAEALSKFFVNNLIGLKVLAKSNMDRKNLSSIISTLMSHLKTEDKVNESAGNRE